MVLQGKHNSWASISTWLVYGCLAIAAFACQAGEFRLESVGVRGGSSANERGLEFNQAELGLNADLPGRWDLGRSWTLQSRLDASAGWLGNRRANAGLGTLGPTLLAAREEMPVSFELGSSPTLLSRHTFRTKNFGEDFQFTTHAGVNWDFLEHLRLSYRFEHMSNAGLSKTNPGLNLHMLGLSYLF